MVRPLTEPATGWTATTILDNAAPPIPDDPRVPQLRDAVPSRSMELGGAAPAVGPGAAER